MSNSSKGIFVVIGGAVVLALAVGAVYFLILGPRSEKRRLQKEIEQWATAWDGARDCLVGPDPRSPDGYEAVILREALSTEDVVPQLADCGEEIKALRRGQGYSAGAEVEEAWDESQKKVTALAEAHAWRIAKTPNKPISELRRALGKAVADLDSAYTRLRERADLDPAPPAGQRLPTLPAGRVLADAKGTPIVPSEVGVSGNVVQAIGAIADRKWLVRDSGTGAPQVIPIGAETVAGMDGSGWGVWVEESDDPAPVAEVRSGPVDAVGDPAGDGTVVARLKKGDNAMVQFALASDPVRIALYQAVSADQSTAVEWLVRSRDGGATWPDRMELARFGPDRESDFQIAADLAQQRIDLFFSAGDGSPRWLVIDPDSAAGPMAPARIETPASQPCVAGPRTWWLGEDDTVYLSEAPGKPLKPVPGSSEGAHTLVCSGERLLAMADAATPFAPGQKVLVCRASGCSATTIPAAVGARSVAAIGDTRGPLVAIEAEGVVVIWSGDPEKKQNFKAIEVARIAGEQQVVGMVEWKGALNLVTRTDKALHIVPLGK